MPVMLASNAADCGCVFYESQVSAQPFDRSVSLSRSLMWGLSAGLLCAQSTRSPKGHPRMFWFFWKRFQWHALGQINLNTWFRLPRLSYFWWPKIFFNPKKRAFWGTVKGGGSGEGWLIIMVVRVVEFLSRGYKIGMVFCLKINISKGNYWTLRIAVMVRCQKLRIISQKCQYPKMSKTKNLFLNWYCLMEKS